MALVVPRGGKGKKLFAALAMSLRWSAEGSTIKTYVCWSFDSFPLARARRVD